MLFKKTYYLIFLSFSLLHVHQSFSRPALRFIGAAFLGMTADYNYHRFVNKFAAASRFQPITVKDLEDLELLKNKLHNNYENYKKCIVPFLGMALGSGFSARWAVHGIFKGIK
jgi:hypothetical protein